MKLDEIGEFGLIERISSKFKYMVKSSNLGIGDDCAIIKINNKKSFVYTTDLLIENEHFLKDKITPFELGYKSLAVNLSDIASMGAKPIASFLSIGIPKETNIEYLDKFIDGYKALSAEHKVALMGGDTTKSAMGIVINVGILGIVKNENIKYRNTAKVGDIICTTGNLGNSAAGLQILLKNKSTLNDFESKLVKDHHNPTPRINEGKWLGKQNKVNAMMDISDGISSDLVHILKASNVKANIFIDKIPISKELELFANAENINPLNLAISGGEDYELLLTVEKSEFEKLNSKYFNKFGKKLIAIGQIISGNPKIIYLDNEKEINIETSGFNHFLNK